MTEPENLPHDLAAEMSAVGAAIQSERALSDVTAIVPTGGWFQPRHETIIAAAVAVAERGDAVDPVLVAAELKDRGLLTRCGGAPYLHTLMSTPLTTVNASYYAEIVADKARLRQVIATGRRLVQFGFSGAAGADVDEVVDQARAELERQADIGQDDEAWPAMLDRVVDSYAVQVDPGLPTPWPDLDTYLGGLAPGTLNVVGARPGGGKSIMAANLATYTAQGGIETLVHSLEMPRAELVHRMVAALAGVEYRKLHAHQLTDWDWPRVRKAQAELRDLPLHIDDRPTVGVPQIRAAARGVSTLGLIVVDYLQLVQGGPDSRTPREQQVSAISRGLKLLARDLGVPVVACAQINRGAATTAGRPQLTHLRESGAIENDADAVILLHRDPDKPGEVTVDVAKNRHGATGVVQLQWAGHYARLGSLAHGGAP